MKLPKFPNLKKVPAWAWVVGGVVLLGGAGEVVREVSQPSGPKPPPAGPKPPTGPVGVQFGAVLTPASASDVASAIVAGLRSMGHHVVRQESWLFPLAVSRLETAQWKKMWNNNTGNVSAWDLKKQDYYINPEVHERDANGVEHPHYFRSFVTLRDGARAMLGAINHHGGLEPADAGDLVGFQAAMTKYLGNKDSSGNLVPYPDLSGIVASLRGTVVDVA